MFFRPFFLAKDNGFAKELLSCIFKTRTVRWTVGVRPCGHYLNQNESIAKCFFNFIQFLLVHGNPLQGNYRVELLHREIPVFITGNGFAVYNFLFSSIINPKVLEIIQTIFSNTFAT